MIREAGLGKAFGIPAVRRVRKHDKIDVFALQNKALFKSDGVLEQNGVILHAVDDHQVVLQAARFQERRGLCIGASGSSSLKGE